MVGNTKKTTRGTATATISIPRGPAYECVLVGSPLGGWLPLPLDKAHVFLASCREQAGRMH